MDLGRGFGGLDLEWSARAYSGAVGKQRQHRLSVGCEVPCRRSDAGRSRAGKDRNRGWSGTQGQWGWSAAGMAKTWVTQGPHP